MLDRAGKPQPRLFQTDRSSLENKLPPISDPRHTHLDALNRPSNSASSQSPLPPPLRMHSYPFSLSSPSVVTLGSSDLTRPTLPRWDSDRPRPLESTNPEAHRSFSRILPPPTSSSTSVGTIQLPPLAASLGSPPSWRSTSGENHPPQIPPLHQAPSRAGMPLSLSNKSEITLPFFHPRPSFSGPSQPSIRAISVDLQPLAGHSRDHDGGSIPRKMAKAHVPSACLNCKRAHLACDVGRPCRRCVNLGKSDTCIDVQHKKRGRPRLKDRQASQIIPSSSSQGTDNKTDASRLSASPVSSSQLRRSPLSEPAYFRSPPARFDILTPPLPTSGSVQHIEGHTHGPHPPTCTASHSVSASSYPFSHPDNSRTTSETFPASAQSRHQPLSGGSAVVTMICSTNLQCARVSEECPALLGYHPSEILERSLFELVHPSKVSRLEEMWTSLIDPVGVAPQSVPAPIQVVMSTPVSRLMAPASGTIYVQENMRLRQRNGMYDFYSVRLHLGGGFGVDLYRRETLSRAYIVASLLKLGNDATHPDPSLLKTLSQSGFPSSNHEFWTPVGNSHRSHTDPSGDASSQSHHITCGLPGVWSGMESHPSGPGPTQTRSSSHGDHLESSSSSSSSSSLSCSQSDSVPDLVPDSSQRDHMSPGEDLPPLPQQNRKRPLESIQDSYYPDLFRGKSNADDSETNQPTGRNPLPRTKTASSPTFRPNIHTTTSPVSFVAFRPIVSERGRASSRSGITC